MSSASDAAPSHQGHRARLRQRFEKTGFEGFADYEIVELLLTLAIPRRDVKPLAKRLIAHFGSVRQILDAPIEELREIEGMGTVAPTVVQMMRQLVEVYLADQTADQVLLNSTAKLEEFWKARMGSLGHEVFEVAYLDSGYRLQENGVQRLEEGDISRAFVYPRKIMKEAVRRSAYAIVLAHNHPNGQPMPSTQDLMLTETIMEAGKTVDVRVIDHIIVTRKVCYSFRREGRLVTTAGQPPRKVAGR